MGRLLTWCDRMGRLQTKQVALLSELKKAQKLVTLLVLQNNK
jgi:hypothetical protein